MDGFRDIGSTDVFGMSASEIRAIARSMSGDGVSADADAVAQTGVSHATSIAELERDITAIAPKWTGEAAEESFARTGLFVRSSSQLALEFGRTLSQLRGLSGTAQTTNQRFSELTDLTTVSGRRDERIGAKVAAEFRSTYTVPVQSDAGTMPLGSTVTKVSYEYGPQQRSNLTTATAAPEDPDSVTPSGGSGDDSGGGNGDGGETTPDAGADPVGTQSSATDEPTASDGTGTDTASDQGNGTPTGSGTGSGGEGSGTGTDPSAGAGDESLSDDPAAAYEPTADAEQPSSFLSPSATVPVGAAGRTPGAGVVGGRGGGQVASPLGLRQDSAVARSALAPTGSSPTTSTGARSSGPYGMPAAGAGGQRGQGDGRHRLPAYLIDRKNGEELVGELPLVGPGVIGQWRSDGPPDTPRAAPPARTEPRPR